MAGFEFDSSIYWETYTQIPAENSAIFFGDIPKVNFLSKLKFLVVI